MSLILTNLDKIAGLIVSLAGAATAIAGLLALLGVVKGKQSDLLRKVIADAVAAAQQWEKVRKGKGLLVTSEEVKAEAVRVATILAPTVESKILNPLIESAVHALNAEKAPAPCPAPAPVVLNVTRAVSVKPTAPPVSTDPQVTHGGAAKGPF